MGEQAMARARTPRRNCAAVNGAGRCMAFRSRPRTCATPRSAPTTAGMSDLSQFRARARRHRHRAALPRRRHHPGQADPHRGRLHQQPPDVSACRSIPGRRGLLGGHVIQRLGRRHRGRAWLRRAGHRHRRLDPLSRRPATASPASSRPGAGSAATASFTLRHSLDHVGPFARSAEDAAAMLGAIAGPDANDPTSLRAPVPDYLAATGRGVRGLRIGVDERVHTPRTPIPKWRRRCEAARQVLQGWAPGSCRIASRRPMQALRGWFPICGAETALVHAATYPSPADEYHAGLAGLIDTAGRSAAEAVAAAWVERLDFCGRLAAAFEDVDVMLMPTMTTPTPTLAELEAFGADDEVLLRMIRYTAPFNLSGHPTMVLPGGFSARRGCRFRCNSWAGMARGRAVRRRPCLPAGHRLAPAAAVRVGQLLRRHRQFAGRRLHPRPRCRGTPRRPSGSAGSSLTSALMPMPPSKSAFGQTLSTITTPGCWPVGDARRAAPRSPCALPSRTRPPSHDAEPGGVLRVQQRRRPALALAGRSASR